MSVVKRDKLLEIAHLASELLMRHPWKLWFWADSIGLEALVDASEMTGDRQYSAYVYGLMKGWIPRQEHRSEFDYCFAGAALVRVYDHTDDPALLEAAVRQADWLAGFRKTGNGCFLRYEDAALELPPELPLNHPDYEKSQELGTHVVSGGPCVFVDTMHFDGPFFARLYSVTGERRWRDLAVDNILPAIELLLDSKTGLFHHFWMELKNRQNGVLWGRGNGWAMLGMLHTAMLLPENDPARHHLIEVFQRQAEAVADLQDTSGDWHTIIDDPGSYLETSIAAFVVDGFSLAVKLRWLDNSYRDIIEKALKAVLSHVEPDGKLAGVSYETFPSTQPEHYRQMPVDAIVPWGQGPLVTAIRSYLDLVESN